MRRGEPLFARTAAACAPLLAWAAHFAFVYGVAAAQCSPLAARTAPSMWLLWLATGAAAGVCLLLLWLARGALRPRASLAVQACAVSALLALAGIGWISVPLLLLGGCG
jgi:hypothetical protein